jgi:hypothetical protein
VQHKNKDKVKTKKTEPEARPITAWETSLLGLAVQSMGEAVGARNSREAGWKITQAIKWANEFLGSLRPTPNLTEAEGGVSSALHTYMRKGMDSPLSVILYRMITEDRANGVWFEFVKELAHSHNYREAKLKAHVAAEENGTTDDYIMSAALELWGAEFEDVLWRWVFFPS